jgi:NADH:ubiquinone reductase (H+-translocating)
MVSDHHVVVVGTGFGGLETVHGLAGAPVHITLVDRRNHHLFQPLLYQAATASLAPSEIAWPDSESLAQAPGDHDVDGLRRGDRQAGAPRAAR